MKKLTLFFVATLLTLSVFAQNADNKWALGLGAGPYFSYRHELLGGDEHNAWKSPAFTRNFT